MRVMKKIAIIFMAFFLCGTVVYASEATNSLASENEEREFLDEFNIHDNGDNTYTITFVKSEMSDDIQEVQFPVWSRVNGQDDIKWYTAQKNEEGKYGYTFELKAHKGLGVYFIHAYGIESNGRKVFLDATEYNIEEPKVKSIDVNQYDGNSIRVTVKGLVSSTVIQDVKIPVWSEQNGQDDLKWYEASKDEEGNYYIDINVKDHKYNMGKYNIHVYIDDVTGGSSFGGKIQTDINLQYGSLYAVQMDNQTYRVILEGLKVPDGTEVVRFPIWSKENGQDDLIWYIATKDEDGNWMTEMSLKDHKHLGNYILHAYAVLPNGYNQFIAQTTFETETPEISNIEAIAIDKENGKMKVVISGVENDDLISKIQVPIWSEKKQSDLVWYAAEKQSNGSYVLETDISKHNYNCSLYNVHVYVTDIKGKCSFISATTVDMSPEYDALEVNNIDGKEIEYKITLKNLVVPYGAKNIQFAVWGEENKQNDLKWYSATEESDGVYTATYKINNHKEMGSYQIHAYCTTKNGKKVFIGKTTGEVKIGATAASVQISDVDGTKGTFRVTVNGLIAPSGIKSVQIPMWSSKNQNDLKWYTANKVSEGVYTAILKVADHKYNFGIYQVHVYAMLGNDAKCFVTSTTANIQPKNYIYSISKSANTREVIALGVTGSRVQFPTWSNANGQDDIVWYEGKNCGGGKWNAIINSGNHKSAGTYTTHVYITENGKSNYAGAMNYSLQKIPQEIYPMWLKANMYSSSTPYIALVNRSTHKVAIFQGYQGNWNCIKYWSCADGKASTPTVTGVFKVGSRGYYFNSGAYRCYWWTQFYGDYLFHSVLYNHSGVLMDGRVGVALSHGCVRLQIDNAKWIYDNIPSGTTVVVY